MLLLKSRERFFSVLVSFFVLAGCASPTPLPTKSKELRPVSPNGTIIISSGKSNKLIADDAIVAQIKPGITTKAKVASLLGEPESISIDKINGGEHWAYHFFEIYSPYNRRQVVLFLWFDDNGVLKPKPKGMVRHKTTVAGGKKTHIMD